MRVLASVVLFCGVLLGCSRSEGANSSDDAEPTPSVEVEAPSSPVLGAETLGPVGRPISYVKIWNADQSEPGFHIGAGSVVPIEIVDANGTVLGFLSTCFPADMCGSTLEDLAEGCIRLQDGTDDCVVESSSGTRHIVHVVEGLVTVAEALAAVDLAESGPS